MGTAAMTRMHLTRRTLLTGTAAFAATNVVAQHTAGLRIVVPTPPGGSTDIVARGLGTGLGRELGRSVEFVHQPDEQGAVAAREVAVAAPDGTTLLIGTSTGLAIAPALNTKIGYDPTASFTPVSLVATAPYVLVVSPTVPAKSLPELLAHLRQVGGRAAFASTGEVGPHHLIAESFLRRAGVRAQHRPFKSGPAALASVASGETVFMLPAAVLAVSAVRAGKVRALAVSGERRSLVFPQIPTIAEAGLAGLETASWYGLLGPKNLPSDTTARLLAAVRSAVRDPALQKTFADQALDVVASDAEQFGRFMREDIAQWKTLIAELGLASR